jgi:hypothetical protein
MTQQYTHEEGDLRVMLLYMTYNGVSQAALRNHQPRTLHTKATLGT